MANELAANNDQTIESPGGAVRAHPAPSFAPEDDLAWRAAELDALSYALAHDIRAPVRALDGFSHRLLSLPETEVSVEARHYLDAIGRNARQLGQLIDGLLTCSRVTRQPLHVQDVLPRSIVDRVLAALRLDPSTPRADIRIGELPPCRADPQLVENVFSQLIRNALTFSRTRERAVIEIGGAPDGQQIRYVVSDNGVGFDMRYADELFGIFQRMHQDATVGGVGIGLAIVQRIVHRHGGRAWAEAEPDRGATFSFTLPVSEQDVEADG